MAPHIGGYDTSNGIPRPTEAGVHHHTGTNLARLPGAPVIGLHLRSRVSACLGLREDPVPGLVVLSEYQES